MRELTKKEPGLDIGFPEKIADVRMAQYESGTRTPKENLINELSRALDVSQLALTVPNIDNYYVLAHTLFTLEDIYSLKINRIEGELCLTLDKNKTSSFSTMSDMFRVWHKEAENLKTAKSLKMSTILGATDTLSLTPPSGGQKCLRKN